MRQLSWIDHLSVGEKGRFAAMRGDYSAFVRRAILFCADAEAIKTRPGIGRITVVFDSRQGFPCANPQHLGQSRCNEHAVWHRHNSRLPLTKVTWDEPGCRRACHKLRVIDQVAQKLNICGWAKEDIAG